MTTDTLTSQFFLDQDMTEPTSLTVGGGQLVVFVSRNPESERATEDAVLVIPRTADHAVVALADGFGGHPAGDQAAKLALEALETCVRTQADEDLRGAILTGFEIANEWVRGLGVGAATTMVVTEIKAGLVRAFNVGDSAAALLGQRGKVQLRTVPHSPVGYAIESGLLNEKEAMNHEERHVVSNMVGSADMRIEMGARRTIAQHDTLLMASDGLFDNMVFDDIVERVRKGPMIKAVAGMASLCVRRMRNPTETLPSKPDDLSIVTFRRAR